MVDCRSDSRWKEEGGKKKCVCWGCRGVWGFFRRVISAGLITFYIETQRIALSYILVPQRQLSITGTCSHTHTPHTRVFLSHTHNHTHTHKHTHTMGNTVITDPYIFSLDAATGWPTCISLLYDAKCTLCTPLDALFHFMLNMFSLT